MAKTKNKSKARVLNIKVWPERNDRIWRLISISEDKTLKDLQQIISREFQLAGDHLWCFYLGDAPFFSKHAIGGPRAGTERKAAKTSLKSLQVKRGGRFYFVFDFCDHQVFALQVKRFFNKTEKGQNSRVIKRHGKARPVSTAGEEAREEERKQLQRRFEGLSDEVVSVVGAWVENRQFTKSELRSGFNLARGLHERIKGDWTVVTQLEKLLVCDISGWLIALPELLNREGLSEEALEVIGMYLDLEPHSFLSDKPLVLLATGREDAAREQVVKNTEYFADDPWIWTKGGDVLWRMKENREAEAYYRKALELVGKHHYLRDLILERLLTLLEELGDSDAAKELAQKEEKHRSKNARS